MAKGLVVDRRVWVIAEGMTIGHAGAIVGRGQSAEEKEKALREVGVKKRFILGVYLSR